MLLLFLAKQDMLLLCSPMVEDCQEPEKLVMLEFLAKPLLLAPGVLHCCAGKAENSCFLRCGDTSPELKGKCGKRWRFPHASTPGHAHVVATNPGNAGLPGTRPTRPGRDGDTVELRQFRKVCRSRKCHQCWTFSSLRNTRPAGYAAKYCNAGLTAVFSNQGYGRGACRPFQ